MRLLILSCSATKRHEPGLMAAIDRYDGPAYRVLRRYLREHPEAVSGLAVMVLSAEFGLIPVSHQIPNYDRRMDAAQARHLAPEVAQTLARWLARGPASVAVNVGPDYAPALPGREMLAEVASLTWIDGAIGMRLQALKGWLAT